MSEYYQIGRDRFGIMQYALKGPQPTIKRLTHKASGKMPEQLERWGRIEREKRKEKERLMFESRRSIVSSNTELYETCLRFLESAVERKDEERARYWSKTAFQYCTSFTQTDELYLKRTTNQHNTMFGTTNDVRDID